MTARTRGTGMNVEDYRIFAAVELEMERAYEAVTQRKAMDSLLFAKHLIETLLRQMQDP